MKFRCLVVFLLGLALSKPAASQVSTYVDFSASKLTSGSSTTVLYGPTIGLTAELAARKRLKVSGDLRTSFYGNGIKLTQAAIGPKLAYDVKKFEAYGEILVGFGRYSDGAGNASTDGQTEVNFGIDLKGRGPLDWRIAEFGYEQYYGLGGRYNPKTFSTGLVLHLGKR